MKIIFILISVKFFSLLLLISAFGNVSNQKSNEQVFFLSDELAGNTLTVYPDTDVIGPEFTDSLQDNSVLILEHGKNYILTGTLRLRGKNNIIIEGNGATLDVQFSGKAVEIIESTSITLQNFKINNGAFHSFVDEGRIHVSESEFITLAQLTILEQGVPEQTNLPHFQVLIHKSTNCQIRNSTVYKTHGELIILKGSKNCIISNNKTIRGWTGIATAGIVENNHYYGGYNFVFSNTLEDHGAAFITINDRGTIVQDNLIYSTTGTGGPGIRFGHTHSVALLAPESKCFNNKISNLQKAHTGYTPYGISVDATTSDSLKGFVIKNNLIENCSIGINVSNQSGQVGEIVENDIASLRTSIQIYASNSIKEHAQKVQIIRNSCNSQAIDNNSILTIKNSSGTIEGNDIQFVGKSSEWTDAKAILIQCSNEKDTEVVNIINNRIHCEDHAGIYSSNELRNGIIKGNEINYPNIGIYLMSGNLVIEGNIINSASNCDVMLHP